MLNGVHRIPRKLVVEGDKNIAGDWLGYAEKLLNITKQSLIKSPLGIRMGIVTRSPIPGVTITCRSFANIKGDIYHQDIFMDIIPLGGAVKDEKKVCLCNCNFSIGVITAVETITDTGNTEADGYYVITDTDDRYQHLNGREEYRIFTVVCCYEERMYVEYSNVIGSDFTPWEVGQTVMVMAYNQFQFDCCAGNAIATGCSPIEDIEHEPHYDVNGTSSSDLNANNPGNDDWRATVRIMPYCAAGVPPWVNKYD